MTLPANATTLIFRVVAQVLAPRGVVNLLIRRGLTF